MDRGTWWAAVHGVAKSWTWLSDFIFTFHFHALEKEMATHSSITWRISETVEPGGLLLMESHTVGHDWSKLAAAADTTHLETLSDPTVKGFSPMLPTLSSKFPGYLHLIGLSYKLEVPVTSSSLDLVMCLNCSQNSRKHLLVYKFIKEAIQDTVKSPDEGMQRVMNGRVLITRASPLVELGCVNHPLCTWICSPTWEVPKLHTN